MAKAKTGDSWSSLRSEGQKERQRQQQRKKQIPRGKDRKKSKCKSTGSFTAFRMRDVWGATMGSGVG
jgi:hypothetical protein